MGADRDSLRAMIVESVPFVQGLGALSLDVVEPRHVRMSLPFTPAVGNHVGTMYAGALFTFAEVTGACAMFTAFDLGSMRVLAKSATIQYLKRVDGDIHSDVNISEADVERIRKTVADEGRAMYALRVPIHDASNTLVCDVNVEFHFKGI